MRVECDRDRIRTYDRLLRRQMLYPAELRDQKKSGWQDSNLRPPAPKAGAMTGLRYTPKTTIKTTFLCGETETRTRGTLTRSQISNLLHYHSATSPFL